MSAAVFLREEHTERCHVMADEFKGRYNFAVAVGTLFSLKRLEGTESKQRALIPSAEYLSRQKIIEQVYAQRLSFLSDISDNSEVMCRMVIDAEQTVVRTSIMSQYNVEYYGVVVTEIPPYEEAMREITEQRRDIYMASMRRKDLTLRMQLLASGAGEDSEDTQRRHLVEEERRRRSEFERKFSLRYTEMALIDINAEEDWARYGWRGLGGFVNEERRAFADLMNVVLPLKLRIIQGDGYDPNFEDGARAVVVQEERDARRALWNTFVSEMNPIVLNDIFCGPQHLARVGLEEVEVTERRSIYRARNDLEQRAVVHDEPNRRKEIQAASRVETRALLVLWYLLRLEAHEEQARCDVMRRVLLHKHALLTRRPISQQEAEERTELMSFHHAKMYQLEQRREAIRRDAKRYEEAALMALEEKYRRASAGLTPELPADSNHVASSSSQTPLLPRPQSATSPRAFSMSDWNRQHVSAASPTRHHAVDPETSVALRSLSNYATALPMMMQQQR
eukprot:PhM_4_TR18638/c0_g1_i1/m.80010